MEASWAGPRLDIFFSMAVEVDLILPKAVPFSHIVLVWYRLYSFVAFLTSLNDNLFYGAKVRDNSNS